MAVDEHFDTPYMRAEQVWDNRLGSARVQAANWRLIAFFLVAIIAILSGGIIYVGTLSKVVPYVVEIGVDGEIRSRGKATEHTYTPNSALTTYFVRNFVQSVRSISSDPVINRRNWQGAYAFLTQRSSEMLSTQFRQNDPVIESREKTRSVDIETVIPLSDNSYQVDWVEIEFDKNGTRTKLRSVRGTFSILNKEPTSEEEIVKNPLGIYVDYFSWSAH